MKTSFHSSYVVGGIIIFGLIIGSIYWISIQSPFSPISSSLPPSPTDQSVTPPDLLPEDEAYRKSMEEKKEAINTDTKENEKAIAMTNYAILTADPLECESIESERIRGECVEEASLASALKNNDINLCEVLSTGSQLDCKDQVFMALAQESINPDDCKKITDTGSLDRCLKDVEALLLDQQQQAISEGKVQKKDCDIYTDPSITEDCKDRVQMNVDYTVLEKAVNTKTVTSCQAISDNNLRTDCQDAVYFNQAKANLNTSSCQKIENLEVRDQCTITVNNISDSKIFQAALQARSVSMCEDIISDEGRVSCTDKIRIGEIIASGDIEDCSTLSDKNLVQSCKSALMQ